MNTEELLKERGQTHGNFSDHAYCTQTIKDVIRWVSKNTKFIFTPAQQEAIDMIAHKLGRIAAGNPNHQDHWDDIAGYATLASKSIKQVNQIGQPAGERAFQETSAAKEKSAIEAAQKTFFQDLYTPKYQPGQIQTTPFPTYGYGIGS